MSSNQSELRAEAEAIFGSAARGDADTISDRDILIVDDDCDVLRRRSAVLKNEGFSDASYTFSKLQALARQGALFIQHLKLEAVIISDRHGRLNQTLADFSPKPSYHQELESNAALASLISTHPATSVGALWAADVLYVALRNFGIMSLAERGIHRYSYLEVTKALAESGLIGQQSVPALLKLRMLKSLYRGHETVRVEIVARDIATALAHLPSGPFPGQSIAVSPSACLGSDEVPGNASAYHLLRRTEKWFIAAAALYPSLRSLPASRTLLRWIEDPRAYAHVSSLLETSIIGELRTHLGFGNELADNLSQCCSPLNTGHGVPSREWLEFSWRSLRVAQPE